MRIVEIIEKKRDGLALSQQEIEYWISGVVDKTIPDYQTSALLMAIVLQGMDQEETAHLTNAMVHSGDVIDLSSIEGKKVDKHSTGGVGDKTTLVISPIVASCGGKVAKMSGRGLGHTGGTLDKLESIAGFNVFLSNEAFIKQVNDINIAVVGQTGNLVYADKVLYALRDVTGTVSSMPLIASSIMSKKIAGGADAIILDVKYGEGAFMKNAQEAKELAASMISIGTYLGRDVNAMLTNMNQPLGYNIGNALEVYEAVKTLQGQGAKDLREICLVASAYMLWHGHQADSYEAGYQLAKEALDSGRAYNKFKEWVIAQKGDIQFLDDLEGFIEAPHKVEVISETKGYIKDLHALELGMVSLHLGAGRNTVDDVIDMKAGIVLNKKIGDAIAVNEPLGTLYSSSPITNQHIIDFKAAFVFSNNEVKAQKLIENVL